ncbi:MAG: peptidoglycan-binding domain-containing protein, partial [Deltaproteobacteria bacterium]|nr:peptidoglycan-binding domain-containing protein [Deltaproteobacteria bacterium]
RPPRPAPTAPARRPSTSIGRGARGAGVSNIQSALSNLGYAVAVDGVFGPRTERAVMEFQDANGLAVDGIVGPRTWSLLAPYANAC